MRWTKAAALVGVLAMAGVSATARLMGQSASTPAGRGQAAPDPPSAMANPYRMLEQWPHFGAVTSGAAIGIMLPVMGFMTLMQRYLVRGMTLGAVKG